MLPGLGSQVLQDNDRHWLNVEALLHFDGANGSTNIVDSSGRARPMTLTNLTLSSDQARFGGTSARFIPSGRITFPDDNAAEFGSSDFTLEWWTWLDNTTQTNCGMFSKRLEGGINGLLIQVNGSTFRCFASTNAVNPGGSYNIMNATTLVSGLVPNAWFHFAMSRTGSLWRMFMNGVLQNTITSSAAIGNTTAPFQLGAEHSSSSGGFTGYIDDFRYTLGVGRYTESFEPPLKAFPNH